MTRGRWKHGGNNRPLNRLKGRQLHLPSTPSSFPSNSLSVDLFIIYSAVAAMISKLLWSRLEAICDCDFHLVHPRKPKTEPTTHRLWSHDWLLYPRGITKRTKVFHTKKRAILIVPVTNTNNCPYNSSYILLSEFFK